MKTCVSVCALLFAVTLSVAMGAMCPGSTLTDADRTAALNKHNSLRSLLAKGQAANITGFAPTAKNMLKMVWDCSLEAQAQSWSNGCVFQHSGFHGENIWSATNYPGTNGDLLAMAGDDWWAELKKYGVSTSDVNNYSTATFNKGTGHFTQMAWGITNKLGCGVARCGTGGKTVIITCQYTPTGNMMSTPIYQIGTACKSNAECTTPAGTTCSVGEGLCASGSGTGTTAGPTTTTKATTTTTTTEYSYYPYSYYSY